MMFRLFLKESSDFRMEFESVVEKDVPVYEGAYVITPKVTEQTLETEDRRCTDDIRVLSIPYREVENLQSGYTAIIGEPIGS